MKIFYKFAKISVLKINENENRGYSTCFISENSNEEDDTHSAKHIYYTETEEEGEEDKNRNIFEILDDEISEDDE